MDQSPDTIEKKPTTSPSRSSRLSFARSPFTLTRSSLALTGLHLISLRASPTVLPAGISAQDLTSRALLSQPAGGMILTFIRDHHKYTLHRAAFRAESAADAVLIHKFREEIPVSAALAFSCQIEGAYRASLYADAAADTVFVMKIR